MPSILAFSLKGNDEFSRHITRLTISDRPVIYLNARNNLGRSTGKKTFVSRPQIVSGQGLLSVRNAQPRSQVNDGRPCDSTKGPGVKRRSKKNPLERMNTLSPVHSAISPLSLSIKASWKPTRLASIFAKMLFR